MTESQRLKWWVISAIVVYALVMLLLSKACLAAEPVPLYFTTSTHYLVSTAAAFTAHTICVKVTGWTATRVADTHPLLVHGLCGLAVIGGTAVIAAIEYHHYGRAFDRDDVYADLGGAATGVTGAGLILWRW